MIEPKLEAVLQADAAQAHLPDDLMERIKLEAAKPVPRRRPVLQWAVAAVLALVLAGTADWFLGTGAVAEVLKSLGLWQVNALNPEEMKEAQAAHQEAWENHKDTRDIPPDPDGKIRDEQGIVIGAVSSKVTFEEAQALVDYQLLKPAYVPEGYTPSSVSMFPEDPQSGIVLAYDGPFTGSLVIRQEPPGVKWSYDVPADALEEVMVAGEPAVVYRGTWGAFEGGKMEWFPGSPVTLAFTRNGQAISISVGSIGYPTEELIKVAESLQ